MSAPGEKVKPVWPTVVIVASTGYVVRNYLVGNCLNKLRAQSQVVVLSPLAEEEGFRRAMCARGAKALPLKSPDLDASWRRLRSIRQAFHIAWLNNETWRIKRTADKQVVAGGRGSWPERLRGALVFAAARTLTGPRVLRWFDDRECARALRSPVADYYRQCFEDLRPALVFSPAPLMADEWLPVQVARSLGIPVALSVLSWDNLSTKARLPMPCSAVLVWSKRMRRELLEYYPALRGVQVHTTGAPQFDFYFQPELQESRQTFLRRLGGDPGRPLILYAGVTPTLMPNEPKVLENLIEALRRGDVRGNPQLLIRLHPKDSSIRYRELQKRFPEVLFTAPGERHLGLLKNWQPDDEDLRLLVNTVRHSDLHINVASTMTIDAAVLDRPVINIAYDLNAPGTPPSWGLRIYNYTHYLPITRTGGVRLAHSPEELVRHANAYLSDPTLDREGRRRIVELECEQVDGRAGERVAATLLGLANRDLVASPDFSRS